MVRRQGGFPRPFLCETHGPKYTLVDQPMTYPAALRYCRDNFDDLASIHSERDHEEAVNACKARSGANPCVDRFADAETCAGSAGCWIGLREPAEEGHMVRGPNLLFARLLLCLQWRR